MKVVTSFPEISTIHKCNARKKVEESIIFFKDGKERKRIGAFFKFYEHYFKDRL